MVGSYYGYAGITARMFGAEYHNISKSGATIQSLNGSYDRVDWNSSSPAWSFSSFPADLVVVNIGANDYWRPKSVNKTRYHALLDDLRAAHPSSHIMLFNAYGWEVSEPAGYIGEVIEERSDPNMSWAVFPWVFEQYHGCQTDHAGMAQVLASHVTTVLGWVPGPADVVSGYGVGGDVANGSFERRAPFGGWGWRYFDDPGVTRVNDPAGAHEGTWHLRLEGQASSHQTNPASDGDTVSLTVWLRGGGHGDEVDVTIGFRNQDAGAQVAAPMYSETQTVSLTGEWQRFDTSVTAPAGLPDSVYSARVTFQAVAGATVDIDSVSIGQPKATSTGRNAGSNPASYVALPPVIGSPWSATVDLASTGHFQAQVFGFTSPASTSLPGGQVLLGAGARVFRLPPKPGPLATWSVSIPGDPSLAGLTIHTQAVHLLGVVPFVLSNAQDLLVGY